MKKDPIKNNLQIHNSENGTSLIVKECYHFRSNSFDEKLTSFMKIWVLIILAFMFTNEFTRKNLANIPER